MMAVDLRRFLAELGLKHCPQPLLNDLQGCYETQWSVRLPYGDVHIARNLCLDKNFRNDGCLTYEFFQ